MKRLFLVLFVSSVMVYFTGCVGLLIGPMRGASFTAAGKLKNEEPLKCSKSQALAVKKVAILPAGDYYHKDKNALQIYNTGMNILISEIEKSGRFTLISSYQFENKRDELGLKIRSGMMQSDLDALILSVSKALGCNALLYMQIKQKKVDMGTSFLKAGFLGTIDFPMSVRLEIVSNDNKKELWVQEHDFVVSTGEMGLENTPIDELKMKIIPVIKPLADNLLSSF